MGLTHKVKTSENLYRISLKYGVSIDRLAAYNGIRDKNSLRVGQILKIPSKNVKVAAKVSSVKPKLKPKSLRVIIDAGHGGRDHGAVWGGVRESDLNLKVALRAEASLKSKGYPVTMIRRSDVFVDLRRRAQISNKYRNCIFISIHFNATPHTGVRGVETFYVGKRGSFLAKSIQNQMVSKLDARNRGYKFKRFSVLNHTLCPAVLVECGFISNSYERSRCKSSSYQSAAARAIVSGVENYDKAY
ncbi:N-acetylmuramoyl-L-alanine amidase [bacterium]|nr:N-acetylmuramoyl-L-alanine amidase [bacterium]